MKKSFILMAMMTALGLWVWAVLGVQADEKVQLHSQYTAQANPTPTWTQAQEKAYQARMRAYTGGWIVRPESSVYICPLCDIKSDHPGHCPKCGMEMVKYKPGLKEHIGFAYHCDKCGAQSDKPGECPRHCSGKMVKN
jgi:predicted RNA-binding Zn-ribbon protein involved in translation (DUF1610 family)